ncbi:MAG: hypothetical protein ACF8PN_04945 [Phycisphaerales bacterium]
MSYAGLLTLEAELGVPSSGAVDEYGNPSEVLEWTPVRCHLARQTSTEATAGNIAADTFTAYLEDKALELGLDAASRLRVAGVEWEAAGEPIVARNPRTWRTTIAVTVRRAEVA